MTEEQERADFEAWRRRTAKTANPDKAVALNGFGDDAQYDVPATRAMWTAWQARASLAKPQPVGGAEPSLPAMIPEGTPLAHAVREYARAAVYAAEAVSEGYRIFRDGDQWCAVDHEFIDLQQSPAGFADTPAGAVEQLMKEFGKEWAKKNGEWVKRARAIEIATLSAPVAQPGEAVSEPTDAMIAVFNGVYNGLDLSDMKQIIREVLALAAAELDPYREHLAQQAENIEQDRLSRCLTLMGSASAGEGQEEFSARLAENVNRLTQAVDSHFSRAAAVPEAVERDAARYQWLRSYCSAIDWNRLGHYGEVELDAQIDRLAAPEAGAGGGKP